VVLRLKTSTIMISATLPLENGSAFRPACFTLSGVDAPEGIDIEIRPGFGDGLLGVKRIYSSGTAQVNVAPYVRRLLNPLPMCGNPAGIYIGSGRTASCFLWASDFVTETVTLCGGNENALPNTLLSAAPDRVKIAPGERDEMGIISGDRVYCDVSFVREGVSFTRQMGELNAAGMLAAVIDTNAVCNAYAYLSGGAASELKEFTVRLRLTEAGFENRVVERTYTIERNAPAGRRLAWVNRYGAVDYYTFPVCEEFRSEGSRTRIETPAGYKTVATAARQSLKLLSDPCDAPTAEWLSELFSSPSVWLITGTEYEKVEVAAGETVATPLQPTVVSVTISPAVVNVSRKL
jgi:hypothetical protein